MQFKRSYHVQHATWPWVSLKVQKYWSVPRVPCEEHPCKVTTWFRHILRHYLIHNELQDAVIWTWSSSKGQTKVNIELVRDFDVENISVKLPNDTGNSCRVIMFTRQLDLEIVWKFKKVTQRSTSNSSAIFM